MTLSSSQLNQLNSLAHQQIESEIPDIFSRANYMFHLLMQQKKKIDGGTFIQIPVVRQELQSKGWITGTAADVLDLNPNPMFTYGTFNWKYYYHAITITLEDMTQTFDTKNAIKSLLEAKIQQSKGSITRDLTKSFFGTAANNPLQFNGLGDVFAASGTAYGGLLDTDLGVDDNGDAIWLPYEDSSTTTVNYTGIEPVINKIKERTQQFGMGNSPQYDLDVMISNATTQSTFKVNEQLKQRFLTAKTLESGFKTLEIDGIDWFIDGYSGGSKGNASNLYFLTSKSFALAYKYGLDSKSPLDEETLVIPNQPIQSNRSFIAGNIICNNRRVNALQSALIP